MGMQVISLSVGASIPAVAQQDHSHERPAPLPMEKAATGEAEAYLPGAQKAQIPDLKQTTSSLEHIGLAFNRRLKFEVDHDSKEILIKVIDNETDKVIKVLPPEELQRLHSRIEETIGFLFDKKV